ncbi:hypothetical protein NPIL_119801 [Nephila pilipes]|uniref:Uncharacterized protein n=1 Tax=Nephila pilipes TaxID=299642 RepID=A0A8X6UFJ2_NEPPI|nr:hypothetical protein NPIL_119801 [Nephila pilipes]
MFSEAEVNDINYYFSLSLHFSDELKRVLFLSSTTRCMRNSTFPRPGNGPLRTRGASRQPLEHVTRDKRPWRLWLGEESLFSVHPGLRGKGEETVSGDKFSNSFLLLFLGTKCLVSTREY